jgi:hypothetical protein
MGKVKHAQGQARRHPPYGGDRHGRAGYIAGHAFNHEADMTAAQRVTKRLFDDSLAYCRRSLSDDIRQN